MCDSAVKWNSPATAADEGRGVGSAGAGVVVWVWVGVMAKREAAWLAMRRSIQTSCSGENGRLSVGVADKEVPATAGVTVVTVLVGAAVVVLLPGGLGAVVTGALELGAAGAATVDGVAMSSSFTARTGYHLKTETT